MQCLLPDTCSRKFGQYWSLREWAEPCDDGPSEKPIRRGDSCPDTKCCVGTGRHCRALPVPEPDMLPVRWTWLRPCNRSSCDRCSCDVDPWAKWRPERPRSSTDCRSVQTERKPSLSRVRINCFRFHFHLHRLYHRPIFRRYSHWHLSLPHDYHRWSDSESNVRGSTVRTMWDSNSVRRSRCQSD